MDNAVLKASPGLRSLSTETERLGLLYGLVPRSVAISIAISGLTALALWEQADHVTLLIWLAAATLVSSARGALYVFFRRAAAIASKTALWENLFTAGAGLMGIVWAALVLIGPVSMAYSIFVVFVVGGMAMGAAGILGASQKAFLWFVIPMLAAQIGELFWIGGNVFALMGAIFSFGLFSAYSEFRRALLRALDARMNIEQLHREQRLIFDTATVGILFIRDRKIVDCNQQMADIVGFVRDELIGSSTRVVYPGDQSWNDFGKRAYGALGEGKTFRDELVLRKRNGDQITCDVSLNSLVPSHPEQGIITSVNDISAKKQGEAPDEQDYPVTFSTSVLIAPVTPVAFRRSAFIFNGALLARRLITDFASFVSFRSAASSSRKVVSSVFAPFLSPSSSAYVLAQP